MLTVHRPMAPHPTSHNFSRPGASLLRQPSAEDMDAARQLVSSARGEMTGMNVSQEPYQPNTPTRTIDPNAPGNDAQSIEQASPLPAEDQQLGQACR